MSYENLSTLTIELKDKIQIAHMEVCAVQILTRSKSQNFFFLDRLRYHCNELKDQIVITLRCNMLSYLAKIFKRQMWKSERLLTASNTHINSYSYSYINFKYTHKSHIYLYSYVFMTFLRCQR